MSDSPAIQARPALRPVYSVEEFAREIFDHFPRELPHVD